MDLRSLVRRHGVVLLWVGLLVAPGAGEGLAQTPTLLRDINPPGSPGTSSSPCEFTAVGDTTIFSADDGTTGRELWKTDGTTFGTVLVKVIDPRPGGSNPSEFSELNGVKIFRAHDGAGNELWKTDGTTSGTARIKDIRVGSNSSFPSGLTTFAGEVYFSAITDANGVELWKTDGTTAGTRLVKDIASGTNSSSPLGFTEFANALFFSAATGATSRELWSTDGTAGGTVLIQDINPGTGNSLPSELIVFAGHLFFRADDGTNGQELWRTDGTTNGTVLVRDIFPGAGSFSPSGFTEFSGELFFSGNDGTNGEELWKTDGTADGTKLFKNLRSGTGSSSPSQFTQFAGELLFIADNGTHGTELWKTDGTDDGTVLLKDIWPGSNPGSPSQFTQFAGELFFSARDSLSNTELWRTDGTADGTRIAFEIRPGSSSSSPSCLAVSQGTLFFAANDGTNGVEPWILTTSGSPICDVVSPVFAECKGSTTTVTLDASMSSGSGIDPLMFSWVTDCPGPATFDDANSATPVLTVASASLPIQCTATLTLEDGVNPPVICTSVAITIDDTTPPTITCPAALSITSESGLCSATVTYTEPVGTDLCGSTTTVLTAGLGSDASFPVGITTETYEATDEAGLTSECSFTVEVVDATPPTLTCPDDISVPVCGSPSGTPVTFAPDATDNCSEPIVVCAPPSGTAFPVGITTVTCTATDDAGLSAQCSFTVEVIDTDPPTIACPQNITAVECTSPEGAIVTFSPTATDNCSTPTVTCAPPSGATFPLGVTTVTCTATDDAGLTTECSFTVEVVDTTAPVVTCADNITAVECDGAAGAVVEFSSTATDDCSTPAVTCAPPSGTIFPVGVTTVNCTATDDVGLTAECSFTVEVVDTTPPMIDCPANLTAVECTSPEGAIVDFSPTAADNCSTPTVVCEPPSGSTFPLGVTTVTCTATDDGGLTAECSFTVEVVDTTPPTIDCPANLTAVECTGADGAVVEFNPTASDNCSAPTVICEPPSGSTFPLGVTTVACTTTDDAGLTAECSFTVEVVDTTPPAIACPGDITAAQCTSPDGAVVDFHPTATDNCSAPTVVCAPPSGSTFPLGTTTVTCSATDSAGLTAECSFTVAVVDIGPPVISLNGPETVTLTCAADLYDEQGVSVSDDCDSAVSIVVRGDVPDTSSPGIYVISYDATDEVGNTAQATRTVTIIDTTPPDLVCPDDLTISANAECALLPTAGTDPGSIGSVSVTDNCSAPEDILVTSDAPATIPLGTTIITWTAEDGAGNRTLCTQSVTVVDDTAPEITCPALFTVAANADCSYLGPIDGITATDNCTEANNLQLVSDSPDVFTLGDHLVTWSATDAAGNTSSCEQTVSVVDVTPPTIVCPEIMTVPCLDGEGAIAEFEISAADNCTAEPEITSNHPSGSLFPLGRTTVTCTATDGASNTATCSFDVIVTCGNLVLPGDCNSDGDVDISDALCLLGILFLGTGRSLPCGDGSINDPANEALMSWGEVPDIDLSDAVALLNWKFLGGPAHVLGSSCTPIAGCPDVCGVEL